jgi:hypothetical protein
MQMNKFEDALEMQSRRLDQQTQQLGQQRFYTDQRFDQLEAMIRNHLTISHPKGQCMCILVLGKDDARCTREYGHAGAHETLFNNWKYTWEQVG